MASLSWKAEASYNYSGHEPENDWILLNNQTGEIIGEGDMAVAIKLLPSTTFNDTDTGGTVTFTCTSCEGETIKKINVRRCPVTECEVKDVLTEYGTVIKTIPPCQTSATTNIPYTSTTEYVLDTCEGYTPPVVNFIELTITDLPVNDTTSEVYHYYTYTGEKTTEENANLIIKQEKGPCNVTCECSDFSDEGEDPAVIWATDLEELSCEGGTFKLCSFNEETCVTDVKGTTQLSWITIFEANNGEIKFNATKNTGNVREGIVYITFKANGGSCTALSHKIKQIGPCEPDCGVLNIPDDEIVLNTETCETTINVYYKIN